MGYKVAVVGATGNVGREILNILAERNFPADDVVALASKNSVGKPVAYGDDHVLPAQALDDFDFAGTDLGLFSPGAAISAIHAPRAADRGCVVIDNTSKFRMDDEVPLLVPEVNPEAADGFRARNIIANPNCSTIQMVVALKPLHDLGVIKRVVVSTYQSVSGAGREAMDELFDHTKAIFVGEREEPHRFAKPIPFNVIPQIDVLMQDGSFKEEWKMVHETKKIMGEEIEVTATCVRVPVFVGHAESVNVEFFEPVDLDAAREALAEAPGVVLLDRPEELMFATPQEVAGEDGVYVSRLRVDPTVPHGLNLWVVSDNLRKGAALNSVQIAELLIERGLI